MRYIIISCREDSVDGSESGGGDFGGKNDRAAASTAAD